MKSLAADLDSLLATGRSRDDLSFDPWLTNASKVHQEWLNRIVMPQINR